MCICTFHTFGISETEALQQDMERCSLAMGISAASLQLDIKIIAKNANAFLNAIWSVVPRYNFSDEFKKSLLVLKHMQ